MTTIAVAICTFNRPHELRAILGTLAAQTRKPDELIVVDSSDPEIAGQNEHWVGVLGSLCASRVIHQRAARGLTRQRNVAIDLAQASLVAYFDDDCLLDSACVEEIVKCFAAHPTATAVTCNMLNGFHMGRFNLYHHFTRVFLLPGKGDGRFKKSCFPSFTYTHDADKFVECLCGGGMIIRRTLLAAERFDEHFVTYSYMEDEDISRRLLNHGPIVYASGAKFFHNVSSSGRISTYERERQFMNNHYYLFRKNWPSDTRRTLAFAWSVFGYLALAYLLRNRDMQLGVRAGIGDLWRQWSATPHPARVAE